MRVGIRFRFYVDGLHREASRILPKPLVTLSNRLGDASSTRRYDRCEFHQRFPIKACFGEAASDFSDGFLRRLRQRPHTPNDIWPREPSVVRERRPRAGVDLIKRRACRNFHRKAGERLMDDCFARPVLSSSLDGNDGAVPPIRILIGLEPLMDVDDDRIAVAPDGIPIHVSCRAS